MSEPRKAHWDALYQRTGTAETSWYQETPRRSLEFIRLADLPPDARILDVGGGDSTLVDHLLQAGFTDLTVLDLASQALARSQARLGTASRNVHWITGDVLEFRPSRKFALWHDRAVFHFLRDSEDQARYLAGLQASLAPGGYVVIATFGPDGPPRCSGLPVERWSAAGLSGFLGSSFELLRQSLEDHTTPRGARQQFLYGLWRHRDAV